ncbi:hypothetical protein C4J81_03410 [Deltaproteobacteria bacterium Smac51]|nr:hypothetical protein C4J81_03410 [Deltaproteobacteria bacterium Smac51]
MKPAIPQQLSLFDGPALRLGSVGRAVKLALSSAAAESGLSREEIVHRAAALSGEAGINLCPGGRLSLDTLNKWLNVNSPAYMPGLLALMVLCEVLEDRRALVPVLEVFGLEVMGPEDKKFRDLGRATHRLKEARRALKKAEEKL